MGSNRQACASLLLRRTRSPAGSITCPAASALRLRVRRAAPRRGIMSFIHVSGAMSSGSALLRVLKARKSWRSEPRSMLLRAHGMYARTHATTPRPAVSCGARSTRQWHPIQRTAGPQPTAHREASSSPSLACCPASSPRRRLWLVVSIDGYHPLMNGMARCSCGSCTTPLHRVPMQLWPRRAPCTTPVHAAAMAAHAMGPHARSPALVWHGNDLQRSRQQKATCTRGEATHASEFSAGSPAAPRPSCDLLPPGSPSSATSRPTPSSPIIEGGRLLYSSCASFSV